MSKYKKWGMSGNMSVNALQTIALALGIVSGSVMIAMLATFPRILPPLIQAYLKRRRKRAGAQTLDLETLSPQQRMTFELGYSMAAIGVSFLFGAVTILLYRLYAPDYLVWFGVTEILSYLLGFAVYAVSRFVREKRLREEQ
jgi:hypothetical protein